MIPAGSLESTTDCRWTVGRQTTDRLPTGYRQVTDKLPTGYRQATDRLPTGFRQLADSFPHSKHDPETIIILINITYLPVDGERVPFRGVYRKLMKYVANISFANLVTNRTINVLRFEGDLIQTSEIHEESYLKGCQSCR